MVKWNNEQSKAIYTRDKNILVSASAGSGKTAVLIARLKDIVINNRIDISRILAMTFTEAAANEMKKRLAKDLQQAYDEASDEALKAYIKKQLSGISDASISTIHSFCLDTIKKYYYIIGLDPQRINNIMDEGTASILMRKAMKKAFDNQYAKLDDDFIALCEIFSTRSESDDDLQKCIKQLSTMANTSKDPQAYLEHLSDDYHSYNTLQDLPKAILDYFFASLKAKVESCKQNVNQLYNIVTGIDGNDDSKLQKKIDKSKVELEKKINAFDLIEESLAKQDYLSFQSQFKYLASIVIPPVDEDSFKKCRKLLQDNEDKLAAELYDEAVLLNDLQKQKPLIDKLSEICLDYRNYYAQAKQEMKYIDFDDMEHLALEIIKANNGQIAKRYQEHFYEIMVDEFQDSNAVQNELITLISKHNNVFRVGDIKQSIYGFRHAKPDIMRNLMNNVGEHDEIIYLSNNYRSQKNIIDFNNVVYENLMNIDGFNSGFSNEDIAYHGLDSQFHDPKKIKFYAINPDLIKEEKFKNNNELKSNVIAKLIIDLMEKEQLSFRDFAILTRSNKVQLEIKDVFDELNIPCFVDVKSGFYESSAVSSIISAIEAIDNPYNDLAFIAYLSSAMMQFSMQELAQIKLAKAKLCEQQQMLSEDKVYELSYYEYLKDDNRLAYFNHLYQNRNLYSLSELIKLLYLQNDYYEFYTSQEERVNLDLLFDQAINFESNNNLGIHAFIEHIASIDSNKIGEATSIGKDADVVRIMSIHQSKGLQFKVVFVYSTSKMMQMENSDLCIFDEDLKIGLKSVDLDTRLVRKSINRLAIEYKKNQEELEEEMRILYVATTRAQQQMYFVDIIKDLNKFTQPLNSAAVFERNGYSSWLLPYFAANNGSLMDIVVVDNFTKVNPLFKENMLFRELERYAYPITTTNVTSASKTKLNNNDFTLVRNEANMDYGTKMHKMIELLAKEEISEVNIKHIAQNWNYTLSDNDIQKLINLYHNDFFKQLLSNKTYFELAYQVKQEDNLLSGYIDFMSESNDEIIIVDFKTDAVSDLNKLANRYHDQLMTYAKAIEQIIPHKKISTYLYSLYNNSFIKN